MEVEFKINNVDDGQYEDMRKLMKQKYNMKIDDMLAIEGCINDDKTILGGKNEFLAHFCTFFNFNICFSAKEYDQSFVAYSLSLSTFNVTDSTFRLFD